MSDVFHADDATIERGPLLWWQKRGLRYTNSGYGSKIPTEYIAHWRGRKYRVYCSIHSNCGVMYITSRKTRCYLYDYQFPSQQA